MSVKAKFRCEALVDTTHGPAFKTRVAKFRAVYGTQGENADFSKATPFGELSLQVDESTPAFGRFQPGKEYYLNIEEIPEPAQ